MPVVRAYLQPTRPLGLPRLEIDVLISKGETDSAKAAMHPVTGGEALTDEINFDPKTVSLDMIFSDLGPSIVSPGGAWRAQRLLEQLRGYYRAKALITLVLPDEPSLESMVLVGISTQRDRSTGKARPVSVTLQQIRIASLALVDAVSDADVQALGGLSSVDLGLLP